jgi:hypothetical protein
MCSNTEQRADKKTLFLVLQPKITHEQVDAQLGSGDYAIAVV